MFVHAGIIKPFIDKLDISNKEDLYKISYLIRKWLLNLVNDDNIIDIISSAPYSLFWSRVLGSIPNNININDPKCQVALKEVLQLFSLSGVIVGHTPQSFSQHLGINSTCSGKLFRIDTGSSKAFNEAANHMSNYGVDLKHVREPQVLYIKYKNNKDKEEQCIKVLKRGGALECDELMSKNDLARVKSMMKDVYKVCNKDELDYDYTFYKLFEMLDMDHLLKFVGKGGNIKGKDRLWKKVCGKNRWVYNE